MSVTIRRTNRGDVSRAASWSPGFYLPLQQTVPTVAADARRASLGNPLAFTQSREGFARVVREVHVNVGISWRNDAVTVGAGAPVVAVGGRLVLIAGGPQALNGVTLLLPGTDLSERINGRLLFDSLVSAQGVSAFRWSAESGPYVEADEYLTALLAVPEAGSPEPAPTLPVVIRSFGSVNVATQAVGGEPGGSLGALRGVDRG